MARSEPTRGERFAVKVREEYELSLSEDVLLDEISETLDALEDPKLSDTAKRQHRIILSRLLGQLALDPPEDGTNYGDGKSRRGAAAAHARWRRHGAA